MYALLLVGVCILLGSFGQVMMKTGMTSLEPIDGVRQLLDARTLLSIAGNVYVVLGVSAYAIGLVAWLGALSVAPLSLVYPLLSMTYVIVTVSSVVVFGEEVGIQRWAGIAMVIGGCTLVMQSR